MLCDGCKKNDASIVLHMMTNGQVATRSLCPDCARKAHYEMSRAFSTMGIQMEGLQGMVEQEKQEQLVIPRMICANCRMAYDAITYSTSFGCPSCYRAFEEQVVDFLSGIKPKPIAVEEMAAELPQLEPNPVSGEELRKRIANAVMAEEYEQAAELRDQLRQMEGSLLRPEGKDV